MARRSRRGEIVAAATRLLAREGSDGFSASALALEAGVSKANIFHHFESLEAVVLEAFESAFGEIELFAAPEGKGFADWLSALGTTVLTQVARQQGLLAVYFAVANRALADPVWQARVGAHIERFRQALAERLSWFPECRDPVHRQALAEAILFSLDGLAFHALMAPERRDALTAGWTALARSLSAAEQGTGP